jgi:hypothetical protein
MWVFSICAPTVFYLGMEDPTLIVSVNAGEEEEPGEGEKQDVMEETKALPGTLQLQRITRAQGKTPPSHNRVNSLELVHEVVLPPPETHPHS